MKHRKENHGNRSKYQTGKAEPGTWDFRSHRSGFLVTNTEAVKEWDGKWVHHSEYVDRHPNDIVPVIRDDMSVREPCTPVEIPDFVGCNFTIRNAAGTLIGAYYDPGTQCGISMREEATTAQLASYRPTVEDQTFYMSTLTYVNGDLVGTIAATDASGAGLTYEIVDTTIVAAEDGDNYIIPTSSSGAFRIRDLSSISLPETFTVKVTTNSPGRLTDTATITISDFAYANYGTVLTWVDPSTIGAPGTVSSWGDLSGNAYDLVQAVSGERPTRVEDSLNGYAGVQFDGSDNILTSEAAASYWKCLHDGTAWAAFIVIKSLTNAATTESGRIFNTGNNSAEGIDVILWDDSSGSNPSQTAQLELNKGAATNVVTATGAGNEITANTPHVLCFIHNENMSGSNDIFIYCDGVLVASANRGGNTYGTSNPTHTLAVGGTVSGAAVTAFLKCVMYEIVFIQGALDATDVSEVTSILNNKYGLQMATSGSVDFIGTRDSIILAALKGMNVINKRVASLDSDDASTCAVFLNQEAKHWMTLRPNQWKKKKAFIFPEKDKYQYLIGANSTDDRCFNSYSTTVLTADSAASDTTLTVDTLIGSNTNLIGVELDSGSIHWTTINGAPSGSTITLTSGVATAAASGNRVYVGSARITRPVKIYSFWREHVQSDDTVYRCPMEKIAFSDHYRVYGGQQVNAIPTMAMVEDRANVNTTDPVLINLLPTAEASEHVVVGFMYEALIEDFDASGDNPDFPVEATKVLTLGLQMRTMTLYGVPDSIKADIRAQYQEAKDEFLRHDSDDTPYYFEPDYQSGYED